MRCPAKFSLFLKENIVIELNSNIFVECTLTLHRHTDVLLWKNKETYLQVQGILVYTNTSCSCMLSNRMKKKCYLTVIWVIWDLLYRTILDNSSGFRCSWQKRLPYGDKSRVSRLHKITDKQKIPAEYGSNSPTN